MVTFLISFLAVLLVSHPHVLASRLVDIHQPSPMSHRVSRRGTGILCPPVFMPYPSPSQSRFPSYLLEPSFNTRHHRVRFRNGRAFERSSHRSLPLRCFYLCSSIAGRCIPSSCEPSLSRCIITSLILTRSGNYYPAATAAVIACPLCNHLVVACFATKYCPFGTRAHLTLSRR